MSVETAFEKTASPLSSSNTSGGLQRMDLSAISAGIETFPALRGVDLISEVRQLPQDVVGKGMISPILGGVNLSSLMGNNSPTQGGTDLSDLL